MCPFRPIPLTHTPLSGKPPTWNIQNRSLDSSAGIDQLRPSIDSGLEDSDLRVQHSLLTAPSFVCEMLPNECVSRHQILVLQDSVHLSDPAYQINAMTAPDSLLEVLDNQPIRPWLNLLMDSPVVLMKLSMDWRVKPCTRELLVGAVSPVGWAMRRITSIQSQKDK